MYYFSIEFFFEENLQENFDDLKHLIPELSIGMDLNTNVLIDFALLLNKILKGCMPGMPASLLKRSIDLV